MNDDSEVVQQKLLKFLRNLIPDLSPADVEAVSRELGIDTGDRPVTDLFTQERNPVDRNIPQEASSPTSSNSGFENFPDRREILFQPGEIPAVQDRFYSLLKQKLQTEMQNRPPLFPWETEVHDYESNPVSVWMNQLKSLKLPMSVPENVLAQLLQKCQDVAQSSLLEGARLVRAVEELFPGQDQALNHLAGLVMTAPARSPATQTDTDPSVSYESAGPARQMVLSLLAAREILTSLNLTLSPSQNRIERHWLVDDGTLSLTVEYDPTPTSARLRVQGSLPTGGSFTLKGTEAQARAERPSAGSLGVELFDPQPDQVYSLEVRLSPTQAEPLVFAVKVARA
jgi:hypothetical protein